jgi:disulfide bond formation protein DsbB
MKKINSIARELNTVWIFGLAAVLISGSLYQFIMHERPCSFCLLQRLAMLSIAIGPMLNLRFGFSPFHYAVSLCGVAFGTFVCLKHLSMYMTDLYTWAFFTFVISFIATVGLSFLQPAHNKKKERLSWYEKLAFALLIAIASMNVITTYILVPLQS